VYRHGGNDMRLKGIHIGLARTVYVHYRDKFGNIVHHQKNKVLSVNTSSSNISEADKWKDSLQKREEKLKAVQKVPIEEGGMTCV